MKKMNARVWKTSVALIFSLTLIFPAMGFAEYPEKPITAYYGYKTGGACYISFNALIKGAMEVLGETIVMKEKAGATATICAGTVSKAKPDGYTIGIIKSTTITNAPFVYKLPYDSFNDLTFIYAYAGPAGGFVVNAENPATTWEEFLENVRQNPGRVTYATSGSMGVAQLIMEHIGRQEQLKWNGLPTKGGAAAMKLLLGKKIDGYAGSGSSIVHVEAGRARLLLDFGSSRLLPDVPTLQEKGYDLPIGETPYMIVGPKGLPEPIRQKLVEAFRKGMESTEYLKAQKSWHFIKSDLAGPELETFLKNNSQSVKKVLTELGKLKN